MVYVSSSTRLAEGMEAALRLVLKGLTSTGTVWDLARSKRYRYPSYTELSPVFRHDADGHVELHFFPDRWVTIPEGVVSLHTDASCKAPPEAAYAITDSGGLVVHQMRTQVNDITEAESQALDDATHMRPESTEGGPLVITCDSQGAITSRKVALQAMGGGAPVRRATAGFQHQRFVRSPPRGVFHIIKVESHLASESNEWADTAAGKALEDEDLPDATGKRWLPGALLPAASQSTSPLCWLPQLAKGIQGGLDAAHTGLLSVRLGVTVLPTRGRDLGGLNRLQTKRVLQIRGLCVPTNANLLRMVRHKNKELIFPREMAYCDMCGLELETVAHLFRCPYLLRQQQDMWAALAHVATLPGPVRECIAVPEQCVALAGGLLTFELEEAWGRPPPKKVLSALHDWALDAFIVLWRDRCSLHCSIQRAERDPAQVAWKRYLRGYQDGQDEARPKQDDEEGSEMETTDQLAEALREFLEDDDVRDTEVHADDGEEEEDCGDCAGGGGSC